MKLKSYFGTKQFYRNVLRIMLPIMLQNAITTFVSLLDNIMVGQVGTEQMSGVAIRFCSYLIFASLEDCPALAFIPRSFTEKKITTGSVTQCGRNCILL